MSSNSNVYWEQLSRFRNYLFSFMRGLTDSVRGTFDLFFLDNSEFSAIGWFSWSVNNKAPSKSLENTDKVIDRDISHDPSNEFIENFARSRALERREKQRQQINSISLSTTKGSTGGQQTGFDTNPTGFLLNNKPPNVLERTFKCCVLNIFCFWFSIVVFNNVIIPSIGACVMFLLRSDETFSKQLWYTKLMPILNATFSSLWVLPFFFISKVINAIWFQDIADSAFKSTRGRQRMMSSLSVMIADTVLSVMVEYVFLLQSICVGYLIPVKFLATFANLLHLCLLHALYCFEYKWYNQGLELHQRVSIIETHWPYFVGFGLPLAVLTNIPSDFILSGCLFSILFPLFLVSANKAQFMTPTEDNRQRINVNGRVRHSTWESHQKLINQDDSFRIPIFYPSIVVSNLIFKPFLKNNQKHIKRNGSSKQK